MLKRTPNTNSINNHNKSEGCCCLLAGFCTQAVAASVCIDYFFKSSYYLLSQVQHICDSICSTACLLLTQPRHRTFAFATALFTCVLQCSYQLFLQLRTFVAVYNHLAALRPTRQSIKCLQRLTGNSFGQPLTHAFTQSSFAGCVNLSICVAVCHDQLSHSMNNSVPPRLKCISCILRFVYSPPACVPEYVLILALRLQMPPLRHLRINRFVFVFANLFTCYFSTHQLRNWNSSFPFQSTCCSCNSNWLNAIKVIGAGIFII